ncbi:zinc-binding protein A33-like isoform X2 [Pseudophryne corroboree]|uniref:zinc-binding protein A33-like isoform X2 n=1 Tax=Pseudophryne corroboree TaxID=495146 RepID=UPI0030815A5B
MAQLYKAGSMKPYSKKELLILVKYRDMPLGNNKEKKRAYACARREILSQVGQDRTIRSLQRRWSDLMRRGQQRLQKLQSKLREERRQRHHMLLQQSWEQYQWGQEEEEESAEGPSGSIPPSAICGQSSNPVEEAEEPADGPSGSSPPPAKRRQRPRTLLQQSWEQYQWGQEEEEEESAEGPSGSIPSSAMFGQSQSPEEEAEEPAGGPSGRSPPPAKRQRHHDQRLRPQRLLPSEVKEEVAEEEPHPDLSSPPPTKRQRHHDQRLRPQRLLSSEVKEEVAEEEPHPGLSSPPPTTMASADLRQELDCSICLRIYTDPVTLRCGHNFCRGCIDHVLDTQKVSGAYTCPECRAKSKKRPALKRNITLCNIVGSFRSTRPDQDDTGISCSYCIHSPVPAVKSCLHCEAHLCDNHLRLHSKSPDHVLSDPTAALGNRKCSVHKRILEYYCTEDTSCICVSCCLIGEHRGHKVESLDEASEKKKEKLRDVLQKLSTKRADAEKRLWSLQERSSEDKGRAAGVAERVTALFRDIRRQLEDLEKRVLSEIFRQEERVSLSVYDLIQQLEVKKEELSRKISHFEDLCNISDPVTVIQEPDTGDVCDTEELCNMSDPLTVLQEPDIYDLCDTEDRKRRHTQVHDGRDLDVGLISGTLHTLSDIITDVNTGIYGQEATDLLLDVTAAVKIESDIATGTNTGDYVLEATDTLLDVTPVVKTESNIPGICVQEATDTLVDEISAENTESRITDITGINTGICVQEATDTLMDEITAETSESDITTDIHTDISLQEPVDIFLDVTTSGNNILISSDGKTASVTRERFQYTQVISTKEFPSGQYYWDVDVRKSQSWRVGMCYPTIDRKGRPSYIGENDKSWCLRGFNNQYSVIHDSQEIRLPEKIICNKVRIYLDYEAGELSFYSLRDPIRHLHTYNTTFTEPLHAALWLWRGYVTISGVGSGTGRNDDEKSA